jgi:DNA adenine methylase
MIAPTINKSGEAASVRYPGGKGQPGHWQWICSRMPSHAFYGELYAGKAAVFRHKPPALRSFLCDLAADVVAWHRTRNWPATEVYQRAARAWLRENAALFDEDWLLYFDPPFMLQTRTKKRIYRFEMDERDHTLLLLDLLRCPARCMISGYWSQLYADTLHDWWSESREVMTRGGLRTEFLWTNFNPTRVRRDPPKRAGNNWRERQRIARKVARHERLFVAMPDYEQDAVLAALLDVRRRTRRT